MVSDVMQNIILTDSDIDEISDFAIGLSNILREMFIIKSKECNGKHNLINNTYRYLLYIFYPFKFFIKRKKFNYIIGWQQFYGLFYAFYCRLFSVKKVNLLIIGNFTYKEKKGLLGKIYKKIMNYCLNNIYVDYIHVPSKNYAVQISKDFNIPIRKFIIVPFGLPDTYNKWKNSKVEYNDYALAIGRSNRDFDFLVNAWEKVPKKYKLLIIADQYNPTVNLPDNVILRKDISGDLQFPYIVNSNMMIIPIDNGNICSGDTVLLKALSYCKMVVVTKPSTLAEMYIKNGINGITIEKDIYKFSSKIVELLENKELADKIKMNARKSYENNYSRMHMGENIGKILKKKVS